MSSNFFVYIDTQTKVVYNIHNNIFKEAIMKYTGDYSREISFPLGGIGTGSIGLAGNGRLIDFEIFNRPNKGSLNGFTHFAIKTIKNGKPITKILNGDLDKDLIGQYSKGIYFGYGFGPSSKTMCGFPHFRNSVFDGEFPIAKISFEDEDFPASVNMTAFNPFIPGDSYNSSIPAAFFEFEVNNTENAEMTYQLAFSFGNPYNKGKNRAKKANGVSMLNFKNADADIIDIEYGDMTIATDAEKTFVQTYWYRGQWSDAINCYWDDFNSTNDLVDRVYDTPGSYNMGTLAAEITVPANSCGKVRFVLSWNVPNCYNYWTKIYEEKAKQHPWRNYYSYMFDNSEKSAKYCVDNFESLYSRTLAFKNALHSSTLPPEVIDAASANLSVLKSPTVLRLDDGSIFGWEGCHENAGSCEGTCQHVWNYAYAMCFLFPDLERSIRDIEFKYNTDENGKMSFRVQLPIGRPMNDHRACLDGQMGAVIKCYREWMLSGNDEWLRGHWDNIKNVLEYAWSEANPDRWDIDKDGVLEGRQHHTLDMELFGPSSWLMSMYMAALKAASEMATYLGDSEKAAEYNGIYEKGCKWIKENLFNGRYFIQKVDVTDKEQLVRYGDEEYWTDRYWNDEAKQLKYQISDGSAIDQMLGQWHADILGLGNIFDTEQTDIALRSMMEYNYKSTMREHANPWRIFSLNDEAGSVICVYPEGSNRPRIPIPYCEETMTGFEYSFAGLLCSRGMIEEGLKVTKAVRDRFNGKARNPFNEFECGNNYARSMASYALIPILSGFTFDLPHGYIGFAPKLAGDFKTVWSVEGAWGEFELSKGKAVLALCEGKLALKAFGIKSDSIKSVKIDGKDAAFEYRDGRIIFAETVIGDRLEVIL